MEATLKLSAYFQIMQKTAFHHGYGDYVFIIKDNGIGMTPEFVNHIFEPFERENVDIWVQYDNENTVFFKADGDQDRCNNFEEKI